MEQRVAGIETLLGILLCSASFATTWPESSLTFSRKESVTTVLGMYPSGSTRILPPLSKTAAARVICWARRADLLMFLARRIAEVAMMKQAPNDLSVLALLALSITRDLSFRVLTKQMTTTTVPVLDGSLPLGLILFSR